MIMADALINGTVKEFIHRNCYFGMSIPYQQQISKFTIHGFFRSQKISGLYVNSFILFPCNPVY